MGSVCSTQGSRRDEGRGARHAAADGAATTDELFELFRHTADGVWVSGPRGEILFWNPAAESILGYAAGQVVGRPCREIFTGCDRNGNRICGWPCPIKGLFVAGDLVHHFDMATRTESGRPLWIDVSCIAVPPRDGGPPTLVHLFRDVTTSRQIDALVRAQLARGEAAAPTEEAPSPIRELSRRELQVLSLMRAGATTARIASELCISKATVRNHVQAILRKLGAHSRLEAVAHAARLERSAVGRDDAEDRGDRRGSE